MAAIAGISLANASGIVSDMLDKMSHRGKDKRKVLMKEGTTSGISWNAFEDGYVSEYLEKGKLCDFKGPGHLTWANPEKGHFSLFRDEPGVAPLYYGWDRDETFYFASEVKAILPYTNTVKELQPGTVMINGKTAGRKSEINPDQEERDDMPDQIAVRLRNIMENSVRSFIRSDDTGSWLSGGLDSSVICSIAARYIKKFRTFAAGLPDAPDLEYAREVSDYIKSEHHEIIVSIDDMIKSLPRVIYHLESFDALLVRSSITNFLVAGKASELVSGVLSGEGGDELFAGYEYLKTVPENLLKQELIKITGNLHNTALQRVDRCSSAHGTIAHVPFLHHDVMNYAFSVPVRYKLHRNIEKWILRKAMEGYLPERVLNRPKAKFWEGAGVKEIISKYADGKIKAKDFRTERKLKNGLTLNTREELLYYRIFRDHFGPDLDLQWMGRTEGSPVA